MGQDGGYEDQQGNGPVHRSVSRHRFQHQIGTPVSFFMEDLMKEYDQDTCHRHEKKELRMQLPHIRGPGHQLYEGGSDGTTRKAGHNGEHAPFHKISKIIQKLCLVVFDLLL